jgi:hypothetical protein
MMPCSYGRAQALLVLATEELARAGFLYGAAEDEWSKSVESNRWIEVPREVLEVGGAPEPRLRVAKRYPAGTTPFWDPSDENGFGFPIPTLNEMMERSRNAASTAPDSASVVSRN